MEAHNLLNIDEMHTADLLAEIIHICSYRIKLLFCSFGIGVTPALIGTLCEDDHRSQGQLRCVRIGMSKGGLQRI